MRVCGGFAWLCVCVCGSNDFIFKQSQKLQHTLLRSELYTQQTMKLGRLTVSLRSLSTLTLLLPLLLLPPFLSPLSLPLSILSCFLYLPKGRRKNVLENLRFRFCFVSGFCFRCAITKPHTTATKHTQTLAHTHRHTENYAKQAREILSVSHLVQHSPHCTNIFAHHCLFCPAVHRPVQLSHEYTYFTDRRNARVYQPPNPARLQVDRLSRLDTCQSRRGVDLEFFVSAFLAAPCELCKSTRFAARNSRCIYKSQAWHYIYSLDRQNSSSK